jgi:glycosyltransferase involved in cell wall biosynthesis
MRIGYITTDDPRDVTAWSGLALFIWKSLAARNIEVELIGPLPTPLYLRKLNHLKWAYYHHVHGQYHWPHGDLMNIKAWSREAGRRLRKIPPVDAVLSATNLSSGLLPGNIPLVVYSDSTLRLLYATYVRHANASWLNRRHADKIEIAGQRRSAALVYASEWAAESARSDYGANPEKVHVVPFGANLETPPTRQEVEQSIAARDRKQIRLVFIGVEWERKGGTVALAVTRELNRMGVPAQLTVIGCSPLIEPADSKFVTVLGFVEKNLSGQAKIHAELSRSHFLIVPSLAECFGIVYCEASAFGVPSIARNVGGVASAIRNDRNGRLFEINDSPIMMSKWIAAKFRDYEGYRQLARTSREEFEERLNWEVAGEKLEGILRGVIAQNKAAKFTTRAELFHTVGCMAGSASSSAAASPQTLRRPATPISSR